MLDGWSVERGKYRKNPTPLHLATLYKRPPLTRMPLYRGSLYMIRLYGGQYTEADIHIVSVIFAIWINV